MTGERGKQTLLSALFALLLLQGQASAQPSFSKAGPDPAPAAKPLALEEVFVTSKTPRKQNEAATVKEAYAKVKNGGVIFITEMSSDISNDDKALVIDRPVTIALDPGLLTEKAVESDDPLPRARLNAAADGACVIVGQYELGSPEGRREPRNEVTIRGIEFVPNPSSRPDTCVQLNDGRLFLDNVAIEARKGQEPFRTGVDVKGGELITTNRLLVVTGSTGIAISGGAVEIADGAKIEYHGPKLAASHYVTLDRTCGSLVDKNLLVKSPAREKPIDKKQKDKDSETIGIWAGKSWDARAGDPLAILRGVEIEGFSVGICAAGAGISVENATIRSLRNNKRQIINTMSVGIRAEESIRVSGSNIGDAKTAALIALSQDAVFVGNTIYNSGIGVFLEKEPMPTFRENKFLFNETGINYNGNILTEQSFIEIFLRGRDGRDKRLVGSFTDNIIACNSAPGAFERFRLFRKAHRNECRNNNLDECSFERISVCDDLANQFEEASCGIGGNEKETKQCKAILKLQRQQGCAGETESKICKQYRSELEASPFNLPPLVCAASG